MATCQVNSLEYAEKTNCKKHFLLFYKIINEICLVYILCKTLLPSDAGNNIAQDCQLLFGLVAKEMWFKLLAHVCSLSRHRLLFDPYSLCKIVRL